ncbi:serine/threonine-protein kinase [Yinghuangia sp. YIM S10712]|uniref:serine/threonine-protein kinase n=1 Tax=Yinghuangia sp. YIM S10712 TaxID=3436930 RepID=UPI003F534E77
MTEASGGKTDRVVNGRYRLEEPLGRGGMGTVWLAVDELLRREVAIKEVRIPDDLDAGEQEVLRERAMREARAAARVVHRNVVTIYDVVEDGDRPWIVMELVRARSLEEAIKEDGPLEPEDAAEIGLGVLAALRAARAADVLHRDVKPSNILLVPDGRVVLTDFGIATVLGSATLTATGMLIGSPEYLAPERVLGRRPGAASDLWSLGVTMYQAVEGRSPFHRPSPVETLTAILTDEAEPARNAGGLRPAIEALMRKDPDTRPDEEAAELLIAAVIKDRQRAQKQERRKAAAAGAVAAEAGTEPLAVSAPEPVTEPVAEPGPPADTRPRTLSGQASFARIPAPPTEPPPESRPTAVLGPAGAAANTAPAEGQAGGGHLQADGPSTVGSQDPRAGDTPAAFPLGGFHGTDPLDEGPPPDEPGAAYPPARRMRGVYAVFAAVAAAAIGAALWVIPSAVGDQGGKSGPAGSTVSTSESGSPGDPVGGVSTVVTTVPTFEPWTGAPTAPTTTSTRGRDDSDGRTTGSGNDRDDDGTATRTPTRPRTTAPTSTAPPTTSRPPTTTSVPTTTEPTSTTPTDPEPTGTGGGTSGPTSSGPSTSRLDATVDGPGPPS